MTKEEWKKICDSVTEEMRCHTRPFVTPLINKKNLVGSGNYVLLDNEAHIMTCQHVAVHGSMDYRFHGSDKTFSNHGKWYVVSPPVDFALASLEHDQLDSPDHFAKGVPYERFAQKHELFDCFEIIVFRGYSLENSSSLGGISETNGSAYCSQEKKDTGNTEYFEIFWDPENTQYTDATTCEQKERVKFQNPKGFSGSLVWNTRYREVTSNGRKWTPQDAVVTGIVHRWDCSTKTLLVYRVEHIRHCVTKFQFLTMADHDLDAPCSQD
jgi:hypothetical protein